MKRSSSIPMSTADRALATTNDRGPHAAVARCGPGVSLRIKADQSSSSAFHAPLTAAKGDDDGLTRTSVTTGAGAGAEAEARRAAGTEMRLMLVNWLLRASCRSTALTMPPDLSWSNR